MTFICYHCKSTIPLEVPMQMANDHSFCTNYCRTKYMSQKIKERQAKIVKFVRHSCWSFGY